MSEVVGVVGVIEVEPDDEEAGALVCIFLDAMVCGAKAGGAITSESMLKKYLPNRFNNIVCMEKIY